MKQSETDNSVSLAQHDYPASWTKPNLTDEQRANFERWCVDLETTDAKQGTRRLGNADTGYCCLGRACVALGVQYTPDNGLLPPGAMSAIGIDDNGWNAACPVPQGVYAGIFSVVAYDLNDKARLTFKEIAQVLRWAYLDGERPAFYSGVKPLASVGAKDTAEGSSQQPNRAEGEKEN